MEANRVRQTQLHKALVTFMLLIRTLRACPTCLNTGNVLLFHVDILLFVLEGGICFSMPWLVNPYSITEPLTILLKIICHKNINREENTNLYY